MNASLEDPRGKMADTPECSMPNSEADRANISATRYKNPLVGCRAGGEG
jgi:hypothetical protein